MAYPANSWKKLIEAGQAKYKTPPILKTINLHNYT